MKHLFTTYILILIGLVNIHAQKIIFEPIPAASQLMDAKELKKKAKKGTSQDKIIYGDALISGRNGVKINQKDALNYYKKAFEQDRNSIAAWRLAYFSQKNGNNNEAINWLKSAADENHPLARYEYGKLLYDGDNIKLNWKDAIGYLENPASHVRQKSYMVLGNIYSEVGALDYGISPSFENAYDYYTKAESRGLLNGMIAGVSTFEFARQTNKEMTDFIPLDFEIDLSNLNHVKKFISSSEQVSITPKMKQAYQEHVRSTFIQNNLDKNAGTYEMITSSHLDLILSEESLDAGNNELSTVHEIIKSRFLNNDISKIKEYHTYLGTINTKYNLGKYSNYQTEITDSFVRSKVDDVSSLSKLKEVVSLLQKNKDWLGKSSENGISNLISKTENYLDFKNPIVLKKEIDYIQETTGEDYESTFAKKHIQIILDESNSKSTLLQGQKKLYSTSWLKSYANQYAKSFEKKYLQYYSFNNSTEVRSYFSDLRQRESLYDDSTKKGISSLIRNHILEECDDKNALTTVKQEARSRSWLFSNTNEIDSRLVAFEAEPYLKSLEDNVSDLYDEDITFDFRLNNCSLQYIRYNKSKYDKSPKIKTIINMPLDKIDLKALEKIEEKTTHHNNRKYYEINLRQISYSYKDKSKYFTSQYRLDGSHKKVQSALLGPDYETRAKAQKAVNAIKYLVQKCGGSDKKILAEVEGKKEANKSGFTRLKEKLGSGVPPSKIGDKVIYHKTMFTDDLYVDDGEIAVVATVVGFKGSKAILDTDYFLYRTKDDDKDWYKTERVCYRYFTGFGPITDGMKADKGYLSPWNYSQMRKYNPSTDEKIFTNNGRISRPPRAVSSCIVLSRISEIGK